MKKKGMALFVVIGTILGAYLYQSIQTAAAVDHHYLNPQVTAEMDFENKELPWDEDRDNEANDRAMLEEAAAIK